jgi:hypothetical protein
MDATREIRRCRKEAADHDWTAKELTCRADALEARDAVYRKRRGEEGIEVEDEPSAWQKVRTVVARLKGAVA